MNLDSLGQMATRLQTSVQSIQKALDALHIEPSLVLNSVPYYDVGVYPSVRAILFTQPKEHSEP